MIFQKEIAIGPFSKGFHKIDRIIYNTLEPLPEKGLLSIFVKHTSAGIMINENADPDVLSDLSFLFDKIAPENLSSYKHKLEGPDDMPAHFKSILSGQSVSVPITNHRLNLGTWQSIYFCEFRNQAVKRNIVLSVFS